MTRQDILNSLNNYYNKNLKHLIEKNDFNWCAEIAIYWFAANYHEGQTSNLYKILSESPYKPGPLANFEKDIYGDTTVTAELYEYLEIEFTQ